MCLTEDFVRRRDAEAKAVLLSVLTPAQAQHYQVFGHFDVAVNGRQYRIFGGGASYNVRLLDKSGWRYCIGPMESMPSDYWILSQFLMLTTNEALFLKIANRASP